MKAGEWKKMLIERAEKLINKYDVETLKIALKKAIIVNDNEERLTLQYALQTKTGIKQCDFFKEMSEVAKQEEKQRLYGLGKRLEV